MPALSCRSKHGATKKDLQHAAALLIAAGGVQLPASSNVTAHASNMTLHQPDPQYTSGIHFAGDSNVAALRELARAYEAGTPLLMFCVAAIWPCLHHQFMPKATGTCSVTFPYRSFSLL